MKSAPIVLLASLAVAAPPPQAIATEAPAEGARIRVFGVGDAGRGIVGSLHFEDDGTAVIVSKGHVRRIPVRAARVQVRHPRTIGQGAARGAGIGLVVGALAGAAMVVASGDDGSPPCESQSLDIFGGGCWAVGMYSDGQLAALGVAGVAAIGTLAGAFVGAAFPGERWTDVGLGERASVGLGPSRSGVRLTLAWR